LLTQEGIFKITKNISIKNEERKYKIEAKATEQEEKNSCK